MPCNAPRFAVQRAKHKLPAVLLLLLLTTDQAHAVGFGLRPLTPTPTPMPTPMPTPRDDLLETYGNRTPFVDQAPNGVPIVQIAPTDEAGLSHNIWEKFNVTPKGLIINNAISDYNSQIGGSIQGNRRLQQSAKGILFQVAGTTPSQLRGPIEIAGEKAALIISNPNGLVIDGARLINIGRMTLATAIPRPDNTLRVTHFGTNDVDITIEGDGLDATGADSVDLYAQALHLNAKLHAHDLSLRLGSQDIYYLNGTSSPNEHANLHKVLLDSSELGGMYADRITLVGSGAGLAVKLPSEVQVGGNVQISIEGEIQFPVDTAHLAVGGDLTLQAGSMDLPQLVEVGGNAQLTAKGDLRIHKMKVGENSGDGDLRLEADELYNDDEVSVTGDIELQIEHLWHYNEGGTLRTRNGNVLITTSAARIRLPKKTRSDDCGYLCEDVDTVTADIMRRVDADASTPNWPQPDSVALVIENLETLRNIHYSDDEDVSDHDPELQDLDIKRHHGTVSLIPRVTDDTPPHHLVVLTTHEKEEWRNKSGEKKKKAPTTKTSQEDFSGYDSLWDLPKLPPKRKRRLKNIFGSWLDD